MIEVVPMRPEHITRAAEMFAADYRRLRAEVPALPERMEDPTVTAGLLANLLEHSAGVAALEGGRLVGYLGWWLVNDFRSAGCRAGYVPEWAHAAPDGRKKPVYRALYRAAAAQWRAAGCQRHAISLLARDPETSDAWFWNGFGLTVVDAVTVVKDAPLASAEIPAGVVVRRAGALVAGAADTAAADAVMLAALEDEHARHYAAPPTLMVPFHACSPDEFAQQLADPNNFIYLVFADGVPAGYTRFEARGDGAAEIVSAPDSPADTGLYVRPEYRGRGLAPALLGTALRDFSACKFVRCSVDFESFNPEAAAFWPRYFEPVCLSVTRAPELP